MINWGHVVVTHAPQVMFFGFVLLFAQIVHQVVTDLGIPSATVWSQRETVLVAVKALLTEWSSKLLQIWSSFDIFGPAVKTTFALLVLAAWYLRRQNPVYLLSYATFKAPDSWKVSHKEICEIMRR